MQRRFTEYPNSVSCHDLGASGDIKPERGMQHANAILLLRMADSDDARAQIEKQFVRSELLFTCIRKEKD
jgi:hypothetical protein